MVDAIGKQVLAVKSVIGGVSGYFLLDNSKALLHGRNSSTYNIVAFVYLHYQ